MLHIRLPKDLHERLKEAAERQGTTMNSLVIGLLAAKLGFDPTQKRPRGAQTPEGTTHEEDS